MAETINIKKRLIGKEDINFDVTGLNERANFITPSGEEKVLTKVNASHIPLTQNTRNEVNAFNVDEALVNLQGKVDSFTAVDVLDRDITIEFSPEDSIDVIQNKINQQKKNLNGHVLSFVFPAAIQQNLYFPIEWQDFFNGSLVISGTSTESRVAVYDRQDINRLFRIYRCQCEVRIQYFHFIHQYSHYGVAAEAAPSVFITECSFTGMQNASSYAVLKNVANIVLAGCSLSNDDEFYSTEIPDTSMYKYLKKDGDKMNGLLDAAAGISTPTLGGSDNASMLQLFAGKNINDGAGLLLYKTASEAPATFVLFSGTGEAQKLLTGHPDGRLLWLGKDITLGFPYYDAGVGFSLTNNGFTAPSDGWIYAAGVVQGNGWWYFNVNGKTVGNAGHGNGYDFGCSIFVPVKSGDVFTAGSNSGTGGYPSTGATFNFIFYPMK